MAAGGALARVAAVIAPTDPNRGKSFLAIAWAESSWEIPLAALRIVDSSLLRDLVAEPLDEW